MLEKLDCWRLKDYPERSMKQKENITKRGSVILADYRAKLKQLDILFSFTRHGFKKLSEHQRQEFVRGLKRQEQSEILVSMERVRKANQVIDTGLDEKDIAGFQKRKLREAAAKFRSKTHTQYAEWVVDGMVSAEILFRVTIFEDFLKHVHSQILEANPKILSAANPNKSATYKEIFADSFQAFRAQQICREVDEIDRLGMKKRLDYFKHHLGIDFGKLRETVIEVSAIRNKIAHGNPIEAVSTEDTSLPLNNIHEAIAKTLKEAMELAFYKSQSLYPHSFLSERSRTHKT
jgi:hypothetical protein